MQNVQMCNNVPPITFIYVHIRNSLSRNMYKCSYLYQASLSFLAIAKVEGVAVSTLNATSVQITWMAIYLPSDGILIGYTVYYCPPSSSLSGLLALCSSHSFPPNVTSAIITNLIQNGVYQFGIVADVAIMNLLLQGDIPQTGSTIMIGNEMIVLQASYTL